MNIQELKTIIAGAGDVGAGGAGFPTAVKLAEGADTLIINAAECEPLLYTDYYLLKRHMDHIMMAAETMMEAAGIPQGYLGVKQHTAARLGIEHGEQLSDHVKVYALPDVYPMGDEIVLIYEVLRRVVKPGSLPLTAGVLVFNVETLFNVWHAVYEKLPVTRKWVTIAGVVDKPVVMRMPVGIPVKTLLGHLGIEIPEGCAVINGGPAMGALIDTQTAVVTKTTKGLLILPEDIPAIVSKKGTARTHVARATSACCQCTLCTEMCPRALIGYPLHPHKTVRSVSAELTDHPEDYLSAALCCGCGVCELTACCQGISPRRVFGEIKAAMAKNGLRYQGGELESVHPDRDYRMLPVERFKQRIGVAPYDRMPEYRETDGWKPPEIRMPLRQHVGAPAVPVVKAGDTVKTSDMVAESGKGISAALHASVDGIVREVNDREIVITYQP